MSKCEYLGDNGICERLSDNYVRQPCIEGPCELDSRNISELKPVYNDMTDTLFYHAENTLPSSPRFTEGEREAMKAVLRLAQEQIYKLEVTSVEGNSPRTLVWSKIYNEYLSHMITVRKMLSEEKP